MKNKLMFSFVLVLLFTISVFAQNKLEESQHAEDISSAALMAMNASQFGISYRETQILMQNRMGIRIEYTLDRANLQLWISPQAGKSMSYVDQNWSNRDDHTNVFDRILIPGCDLAQFDSCNWDPFHSIIYFKNQTLHVAQIYNQPAVLVWFDKAGIVDFKLNGTAVERDDKTFILNFTDRTRDFQSAAVIGEGTGKFIHQPQIDKYRSLHARAELAPKQVLLISCELKEENIGMQSKQWITQPIDKILASNEAMIARDLSSGQFTLKGKPELQKVMDKSRRVALSMQAFKGFMRSCNQYIYHLMWFRDGGMNTPHLAYSGWLQPAYDHTKFALQNPNFTNEKPDDIFFAQMMGGPQTKWQEDGLFYVVWPAFTYWTQSGDKSLCEGKNLETMERAMTWLENHCFDKEKGLFGRYFYCETPLTDSRDDGFDNVTGAPTYKWESKYGDEIVTRSYDNYINMLHYSTYIMLSAMETDAAKADMYNQKALSLEKNMKKFFEYKDVLPSYGELKTKKGTMITAEPYGMDIWDYVWGLSLPTFEITNPERYRDIREQLRKDMTTTKGGYFHCVYFALLTSMDTEIHQEDSIMSAIDMLVPGSVKPGKYLPMPYSVPEMFNISEENPYHDVRPLVYSSAPWQSAVTNLGLHRMPFGIAARATKYFERFDNYDYKGGQVDVIFKGEGNIASIRLNDRQLLHSLQIPDEWIKKGDNQLIIEMKKEAKLENILTASTVQLNAIQENAGKVSYQITCYGKNVLTFKNLSKPVVIKSAEGKKIKSVITKMGEFSYIEFNGRGNFVVEW